MSKKCIGNLFKVSILKKIFPVSKKLFFKYLALYFFSLVRNLWKRLMAN